MTGHINVVLVLQSCTDPLHILPSSSSVTYETSCDISNVGVEEDVDEIEEVFKAVNKEVDIGIKQEEIPGNISFPKSEPDEVSYVCKCLLLDTFHLCAEMSVVFVMSTSLANLNSCTFGKAEVSLLEGLVSNNCREAEILSYIHVGKNPYPQYVS
jgi:hypothetical protein